MRATSTAFWIGAVAILALLLASSLVATQYAGAGNNTVEVYALDMNTTGNAALTVGTIQPCAAIANVGGTHTFDVVLKGVPAGVDNGLGGYEGSIAYDPGKLKVTAFQALMVYSGNAGTPVSFSDSVPDVDGDWRYAEAALGGDIETGDGVALRVTVQAVGVGTSQLHLGDLTGFDATADVYNPVGDDYAVGAHADGQIVVSGTCGAGTPTPPITATPSPTPGGPTPSLTGTPTLTPSPTPEGQTPSPTPFPTPTPSPTPFGQTPSPTPVPTPTPSPTPEGQTPSPTPEPTDVPTPTETSTGSAQRELAGDTDCDDSVTSRDSQALLRNVLGQNPLSQTEPCPDPGAAVNGDGNLNTWGDWDCDGSVTTRDNQALLRNVLGQNPLSQTEVCPDIGTMTNI